MKRFLLFTSISLFLLSCNMSNARKQITGRYYVIPTEYNNDKVLGYKVNDDGDFVVVLKANIEAAGYDDKYLILKQDASNYFIVPYSDKYTYSPEKGIIGPLDLEKFNSQKKGLHIKAEFTVSPNL